MSNFRLTMPTYLESNWTQLTRDGSFDRQDLAALKQTAVGQTGSKIQEALEIQTLDTLEQKLKLDQDASRLAALLEAGRAEARASGTAVRFELASRDALVAGDAADGVDFRFVGLGPEVQFPGRWLDAEVKARIEGASALRLGPEPLIGAQRIVLSLGQQQRVLATDGLKPFAVADADADGQADAPANPPARP